MAKKCPRCGRKITKTVKDFFGYISGYQAGYCEKCGINVW